MLAVETKPVERRKTTERPPPLENGEWVHSSEFLRRFERMPWLKKAELIGGVSFLGSRVTAAHSSAHAVITGWLGTYAAHHPTSQALPNATVILDAENTVQPDALLRRLPEHGGRTRINDAGYLAGPPELIVEVALSSASIDLRDKRRAYCRNQVQEYLVWIVADERVEWFRLEGDEYVAQAPDAGGCLSSKVFPGLRFPVQALLDGDTAKVLAVLA